MSSGLEFRPNYKAFEKENTSNGLFLSGKYYVTLRSGFFLILQWVFCAFGNFDCVILIISYFIFSKRIMQVDNDV